MRFLNVHPNNNQDGFTLIELLVVFLLVGIMAGISGPTFMGLLNKARVTEALNITRGALQEAQRQAIRTSKSCSLTLTAATSSSGATISSTNGCLLTGTKTLNSSIILTNNVSNTISYNFRGQTTAEATLVFAHKNGGEQQCLVISNPLGLIRKGTYSNNTCQ